MTLHQDVITDIPSSLELVVGQNTYISLADADAYFASRFGSESWSASDNDMQSMALITATRNIDALRLRGRKYLATQTLEFPRVIWNMGQAGIYSEEHERYSELTKTAGYYGDGNVPQRVIDACCEEALEMLGSGDTHSRQALMRAGVLEVNFSMFSEKYSPSAITQSRSGVNSTIAMALLRPYVAANARVR